MTELGVARILDLEPPHRLPHDGLDVFVVDADPLEPDRAAVSRFECRLLRHARTGFREAGCGHVHQTAQWYTDRNVVEGRGVARTAADVGAEIRRAALIIDGRAKTSAE